MDEMIETKQSFRATQDFHGLPRNSGVEPDEIGVLETACTKGYYGTSEKVENIQDPQWDVYDLLRLRVQRQSFDCCLDFLRSRVYRLLVDRLVVYRVKKQTLNSGHLPQTVLFLKVIRFRTVSVPSMDKILYQDHLAAVGFAFLSDCSLKLTFPEMSKSICRVNSVKSMTEDHISKHCKSA